MIIDYELSNELTPYLDANERVVWAGRPKQGIIFRRVDIFLIPFGLFFFGFSVFWMILAWQGGGLFALFGVPFLIVGAMILFGRFFVDARMRKRTVYGLTSDRIIIKSGIFQTKLVSLAIRGIQYIELEEKADLTGSIYFGQRNYNYNDGGYYGRRRPMTVNGMEGVSGMGIVPSFSLIPDARLVHRKILELQDALESAPK